MRNILKLFAVVIFATSGTQCFAADFSNMVQAGLWETTVKSDDFKKMPNIPPEQREKMRQMGIELPDVKDGVMVTKVCFSKEMISQNAGAHLQGNEMGCKRENLHIGAGTFSADIVCDSSHLSGKGHVQGSYDAGKSYTSVYDFDGTVNGKAKTMHMETKAHFLSSDCGNVKPMGEMMKGKF